MRRSLVDDIAFYLDFTYSFSEPLHCSLSPRFVFFILENLHGTITQITVVLFGLSFEKVRDLHVEHGVNIVRTAVGRAAYCLLCV